MCNANKRINNQIGWWSRTFCLFSLFHSFFGFYCDCTHIRTTFFLRCVCRRMLIMRIVTKFHTSCIWHNEMPFFSFYFFSFFHLNCWRLLFWMSANRQSKMQCVNYRNLLNSKSTSKCVKCSIPFYGNKIIIFRKIHIGCHTTSTTGTRETNKWLCFAQRKTKLNKFHYKNWNIIDENWLLSNDFLVLERGMKNWSS